MSYGMKSVAEEMGGGYEAGMRCARESPVFTPQKGFYFWQAFPFRLMMPEAVKHEDSDEPSSKLFLRCTLLCRAARTVGHRCSKRLLESLTLAPR